MARTGELKAVRGDRAARWKAKLLRFFPEGFAEETYLDRERDYKWEAHERWERELGEGEFRALLERGEFEEIARRAVATCSSPSRRSAGGGRME